MRYLGRRHQGSPRARLCRRRRRRRAALLRERSATVVRGLAVAHGAAIAGSSSLIGAFVFLFVPEAAVHACPSLPPPAAQRAAALQAAVLLLPRCGSRFRLPVLAATVRRVAASQHHGYRGGVFGCPAQPRRIRTPVMGHLVHIYSGASARTHTVYTPFNERLDRSLRAASQRREADAPIYT